MLKDRSSYIIRTAALFLILTLISPGPIFAMRAGAGVDASDGPVRVGLEEKLRPSTPGPPTTFAPRRTLPFTAGLEEPIDDLWQELRSVGIQVPKGQLTTLYRQKTLDIETVRRTLGRTLFGRGGERQIERIIQIVSRVKKTTQDRQIREAIAHLRRLLFNLEPPDLAIANFQTTDPSLDRLLPEIVTRMAKVIGYSSDIVVHVQDDGPGVSSESGLEEDQQARVVAADEVAARFRAEVRKALGSWDKASVQAEGRGVILDARIGQGIGILAIAAALHEVRVPVVVVQPDAEDRKSAARLLMDVPVVENLATAYETLNSQGITEPVFLMQTSIPTVDYALSHLQHLRLLPPGDLQPLLAVCMEGKRYQEQVAQYL